MEKGKDDIPGRPEADLRRILSLASDPEPPHGAMARLLARAAAEPQAGRVVAFAPRPRRSGWALAALPLAASLMLGIYLGARGQLDFMLPARITGGVALGEDPVIDDLGGMGDAVAENLS